MGWVCHGLFPDYLTNNMVFQFCFKSKKILEVLGTTLGMPFEDLREEGKGWFQNA